jgi:hypothetical protein
MWASLYNSQTAAMSFEIDIVIVVIEFTDKPSYKEFQVFAVLNQMVEAIKTENLLILFNKCPDGTELEDL